MTIHELGETLNKMYTDSCRGEAVTMIHLFGIKYADEIKSTDCSVEVLTKVAGMKESYATEIRKGIKLAKYVKLR